MLRPAGVLVLAMLLLSACTEFGSLDLDLHFLSADANPAVAAEPDTPVPEPESLPAPRPAEVPVTIPPLPRRKPDSQLATGDWQPDPDLLVGLDFDGTKALLGDPAAQLEQPPAKVWAYNGGGCMLNVFFYPSVDDKVFRVLTYEVTGGEPAPKDAKAPQGAKAPAGEPSGAVKVHERGSAVARRCFADLLHNREILDAG